MVAKVDGGAMKYRAKAEGWRRLAEPGQVGLSRYYDMCAVVISLQLSPIV